MWYWYMRESHSSVDNSINLRIADDGPSEFVVSNSIPVSLFFPRSFHGNRALSWFHGNFQEEHYSIFISPLLFLASYIWAVDAARCDGLEDFGKDDTSEGRFGKQPHAPCSVIFFSCIFFLSHTFPCHDRSLTVFLVKTMIYANSSAKLETLVVSMIAED